MTRSGDDPGFARRRHGKRALAPNRQAAPVLRQSTNKFVAGFVGTPPSNFVPVSLALTPSPSLEVEGQCVQLSSTQQQAAKAVPTGSYAWGVRPEDLLVDGQSNMPEVAAVFDAKSIRRDDGQ